MNLKGLNNFFSYVYFMVGASKILLVIMVLARINSDLSNGTDIQSEYYKIFTIALGLVECILLIISIIMIVINTKKTTGVIKGYIYGICAFVLELITPSILAYIMFLVECGMYMKAGTKIQNDNHHYEVKNKPSKQMIKNTDWFYSDEHKKTSNKEEQKAIKYEKQKLKLEEEIQAWKQLLDSAEITEEVYYEETNKLKQKIKEISEKINQCKLS